MESLIETFHLDVKLILAQLVNFLIVLGVLYYFALKPLTKMMNERSSKIEKSLADAKEIEARMSLSEKERAETLNKTKKETAELLEQARKVAESNKQETLQQTKEEVEKLFAAGKEQLNREKEKMVGEVKAEIGGLVVEATKKVLGSALNKEIDKKIIEEAIKEI